MKEVAHTHAGTTERTLRIRLAANQAERTKPNEMPATRKKQADAMDADMTTDEVRRARCDEGCDDVTSMRANGRGRESKRRK